MSLNGYSYAHNNPVMLVDPTGRFAFLVPMVVGALIGAGVSAGVDFVLQGGIKKVVDNITSGKPIKDWFKCVNMGSIVVSAIEGAVFGALGGAVGALSNVARFRNINRARKYLATGAFDLGIGAAWDNRVHGTALTDAFIGNTLAFGAG